MGFCEQNEGLVEDRSTNNLSLVAIKAKLQNKIALLGGLVVAVCRSRLFNRNIRQDT